MQILTEYLLQQQLSPHIAADAAAKFRVYRDFLREQNELFNLTSITDPAEIETKHFIDSLAALPYLQGNVADIGTGAGFPGLPLAIVKPSLSFTLIDSLQKRVHFLDELIGKLSLVNVRTLHARAEDLPKEKPYDTVVSRAVARLNTLCEYCLPFVRIGGRFIAYKSEDCDDELQEAQAAIRILGGTLETVQTVPLYGTDIVRKLIVIRKDTPTPSRYPRNGNKPKKQPLR